MISDFCSRTHVYFPFPFSQRVIPKLRIGQREKPPCFLWLPSPSISSCTATAGSWSEPELHPSLGNPLLAQAGSGLETGFEQGFEQSFEAGWVSSCPSWPPPSPPSLGTKSSPGASQGCGASVPRAPGTQRCPAGGRSRTGVSSNALTLSVFLLTCSKQQHRFLLGALWLPHAAPGAQPSISSAFFCRRKARVSEAEQGWASRGRLSPSLFHVFFRIVPTLQMDPPLQSSFLSPAQISQMSFV